MKPVRGQLELELRNSQQCRSLRRARKSTPARIWFEKMRQAADAAVQRPVVTADAAKLP